MLNYINVKFYDSIRELDFTIYHKKTTLKKIIEECKSLHGNKVKIGRTITYIGYEENNMKKK